jgi:hypothetical protein
VDTNTPLSLVATKATVSEKSMLVVCRSVNPKLASLQSVPLFVDTITPLEGVPARTFMPEMAKAVIVLAPDLTAVHFVPLLVETKTPLSRVPAKRFVPE